MVPKTCPFYKVNLFLVQNDMGFQKIFYFKKIMVILGSVFFPTPKTISHKNKGIFPNFAADHTLQKIEVGWVRTRLPFPFECVQPENQITLGVQIIVRRTIINFSNFSQPYFLIWDRTIIRFEVIEIVNHQSKCLHSFVILCEPTYFASQKCKLM